MHFLRLHLCDSNIPEILSWQNEHAKEAIRTPVHPALKIVVDPRLHDQEHISEAEKMLFIAQKKATDHICNSKDILANIKLNLQLLFDYFVPLVASTKFTVSRNDVC